MQLITPQNVAFTATVTEEEIRKRMAYKALEQIGGLDADGKPFPGISWSVARGSGRAGGYTIKINGPAPKRLALPRGDE